MYTAWMIWPHVDLLPIAGVWGMAALLLSWPYLGEARRRGLALLASVGGLVFLLVAVNTEGSREAATLSDFLFGPTRVLSQTSASASLPYYLLTGTCLFLGLAGLAMSERTVEALRQRPLFLAVGLASAVALLRFGFEKAAAPPALSRLFGVNWLAPVAGGFLYLSVRGTPHRWRRVTRLLAAYALASRGVVVALYVVASQLRLGSHYDIVPVDRVRVPVGTRAIELVPGSAQQFLVAVLVPQFSFWVAYTVAFGLLGALAAALAGRLRAQTPRPRRPAVLLDALDEPEDAAAQTPAPRPKRIEA